MYKIIITGATGFIGCHLMEYLGGLGYEIDSLGKNEFMNEDFSKLENFGLNANRNKIKDKNIINKPLNIGGIKPDIVVHCAWPKLDLQSTDHLEFAEMTCNFYNECKKRGIRVINIGSSSEYGVKFEPMKEDMICEPINTYGIAKLMVTLYAKKLGFNTLRLFTVVGEGGHSFWDKSKSSKKWEWPSTVRNIINVNMVCKAIERLMYAEHLFGEIINVSGYNQIQYLRMVNSNDDTEDRWGKSPQNQYEPSHWDSDTTKMDKLLNIRCLL
jgi:nucleoside-diphosphate-sugar epimerase